MRAIPLLLLVAIGLQAAIIRGVVVEHQTGKPLSRTEVTARALAGTRAGLLRTSTNSTGGFEFTNLPPGAYLVTAARKNFATIQYGQKDFRSAGLPIILDEAASTFLNIRMPRLGVVTGRVVDENDVGLPNHDVIIYRNTRPPQMLTRVQADERGAYRFFGLEPGSYLVRTVAHEYEEGSYVPTFGRDTIIVEEARPVEVYLDQEAANIDVRPKQGRLYKIEGTVYPGLMTATGDPVPVKLTMASEMGREQTDSGRAFRFPSQPPGDYELYAEGPGDGSYNCFMLGSYRPLSVKDKDLTDIEMPVPCVRETGISVEGGGRYFNPSNLQLLARRKDLAGVGPIRTLRIYLNRVQLPPGRWELLLRPPPGYVVVGFAYNSFRSENLEKSRPDGWNEMLAGTSSGGIRFTLSNNPGAIHGLVSGLSHEPVAGAPVYLEGYDPTLHKRVTDLQVAYADERGFYQFKALAPGSYRIFASFEYHNPDEATMEASSAKLVTVKEGGDAAQDLELWVLRRGIACSHYWQSPLQDMPLRCAGWWWKRKRENRWRER
jgi:hypothetical protein